MAKQGLDKIIIGPAIWPGKKLQVQPGDLSKFAPYGNGVYGYQKNSLEPIRGDPPQEETGGLIYFGNEARKEDFEGFLRMIIHYNLNVFIRCVLLTIFNFFS